MNIMRATRNAKGLSLAEVAKHVGCSPALVGMIERGEHKPNSRQARQLEKILGVPTNKLLANVRAANFVA